jgi:WXG100 family type VII secretion target
MHDLIQEKPEEIEEIGEIFARQEEAVGELHGELNRMNDRLKTGWIGLGSEAYFAEAESQVLPAVQRLREALAFASALCGTVDEIFATADQEASSQVKNADSPAEAAAAAAGAAKAAAPAGAGAGAGGAGAATAGARPTAGGFGTGGLRSDALGSEHLASRLNNAGFGSLGGLRSPSLSRLDSDLLSPREFSSGLGSGGGGGGSSSGGGGGGGGSTPSLGALEGRMGSGFGVTGSASGGTPELSYSGLGGFGSTGGPRPPDFGLPLAIAAVSPFAAVLGKVIHGRLSR